MLQLPASERPETVNRSSTPPFGELVCTLPLALKKNGKRASRVGRVAVMNDGSVLSLLLAMPLVITWLSGLGPMSGYMLALGLEPPIVGCEWQPAHWVKLKRGPRPLFAPLLTHS